MTQTSSNQDTNNCNHYLMWFRRDLRIHDNTALSAICQQANQDNAQVTAIFLITPQQWLIHDQSITLVDHILRTLPILATDLAKQVNIKLQIKVVDNYADCIHVMSDFCQTHGISKLVANKEYEIREINRDNALSERLNNTNIAFSIYDDQCIVPPLTVLNGEQKMYKVFTPFYKKWQKLLDDYPCNLHNPVSIQGSSPSIDIQRIHDITQTVLTQYISDWQASIHKDNTDFDDHAINTLLQQSRDSFCEGETHACHRLDQFVAESINDYDVARNIPERHEGTSNLSAYLAIGSLSPRLCYVQAKKALNAQQALHTSQEKDHSSDINCWISELAWRDFYRHILVTRPDLIKHEAFNVATDTKVSWSYDHDEFSKWCKGETGFPVVDSAMRCLNATGFMHNRLRMVTAMFLTKDLLIDWRWGERYFMQMLIDGDFASNNGGWQWSASTGTDAAPYFRIMNPFSQGKTHDSDAVFIKKWLPELANVPSNVLHDENKLTKHLTSYKHIDYPLPMVNHKQARLATIEIFKNG